MNKLQKVCLWLTIFFALHEAIHVLLGFSMLYTWIKEGHFSQYLYAFIVGICGFVDLTLFSKDQ